MAFRDCSEVNNLKIRERFSSPGVVWRWEPEVRGTWQIPAISWGRRKPWKDIGVSTAYLTCMFSSTYIIFLVNLPYQ
jgi:hypothetical protein